MFTFPYNSESEILVYVDGTLQTQTTHYTFFDDTTIRFVTAPALNAVIFIERLLDMSQRPDANDWANESRLTAELHDKEDNTDLWRSQENNDNRGLPKSKANGQWDAESLRITSGKDPEALQDLTTVNWVQNYVTGGATAISGVHRAKYNTPDGIITTFNLVTAGAGQITDVDLVLCFFNGTIQPSSMYSIAANGIDVVFDDPVPNGVELDMLIVTGAMVALDDGALLPAKIAITQNKLLTGNASNEGVEIAVSAIKLSNLGAPVSAVAMNAQKLTGLADPDNPQDGATRAYVLANKTDPFATVSTEVAATLGVYIENTSGKTQIVNVYWVSTSGAATDRDIELVYADDILGANLKRMGVYRVLGDSSIHNDQLFGMVPAGKFWQIRETTGRSMTAYTFKKQVGTT